MLMLRLCQRRKQLSWWNTSQLKQGCVLAPAIFNLFLVAMALIFPHNISAADDICTKCKLDGSLFNVRRLQAVTKVTNDIVFNLQYTEDAALPSHTACGDSSMQTLLHTLVQDWSLTPRESFTSHQTCRHLQLFSSVGITWSHWTVHIRGKYHHLHMWFHCGSC